MGGKQNGVYFLFSWGFFLQSYHAVFSSVCDRYISSGIMVAVCAFGDERRDLSRANGDDWN